MLARMLVLVSLGTTVQVNGDGLYTLLDDATTELERLKSSMASAINSGRNRIESYYNRFENDCSNFRMESDIIMGYEKQKLSGQIEAIEEMAESSGVDISSCLPNHQELVDNVTNVVNDGISQCITENLDEAAEIIETYKYLIDIRMNRVHVLEFELGLCDPDSDSCISPIYERIKMERMYGPDSVDFDTIKVNNFLTQLKAAVRECSNINVSYFISDLKAILQQIAECADSKIKF